MTYCFSAAAAATIVIMIKLTEIQQAAADDYLLHHNKARAIRAAIGRDCSNTLQRVFNHPSVLQYIAERQSGALERANKILVDVEINAAWVLHKAALLANFNIRKFLKITDEGLAVYDFTTATMDDWYCIDEYAIGSLEMAGKVVRADKLKLKASPKIAALRLLGDHVDVQAFRQQVEHSGNVKLENLSDDQLEARIRELSGGE